jgi:hypothetical protein
MRRAYAVIAAILMLSALMTACSSVQAEKPANDASTKLALAFNSDGKLVSVNGSPVEDFRRQTDTFSALCELVQAFPKPYYDPSFFEILLGERDGHQVSRILNADGAILAEIRTRMPR